MTGLSENQLLLGLLAVAVILVVGRGTAQLARRAGQPEVLGELIGGVLLGPSVFGALLASPYHAMFGNGGVALALSTLSWIGAILLLLVAGLEVDLDILRKEVRLGGLLAAFAIIPSLVAGTLFAWKVLGKPPPGGFFLGIVLSVTAVSVVAKILIERDTLRRSYAQMILAAGIVSEVLVWLLISIVSSFHSGSPLISGIRSTIFAVLFFLFMMTLGRRFTFWAMRRVADMTSIVQGQLSLVIVLTFLSAALTEKLGLHALLGAFVFGVLLSRSPRANIPLKESIQHLTIGFFAPIFFVLAGMRVDIFQLGQPSAIAIVLLLFVVATIVKVGFGTLGARLGGLGVLEAALVGLGVNLKGGTDVIVAILGAELGLLSGRSYAMYAVVAILTVLITPPLMALLERHVTPSEEEVVRLNREEATRRSYLPKIERVLVPVMPRLISAPAASIIEAIAKAKAEENEIFDITQLQVDTGTPNGHDEVAMDHAEESLSGAGDQSKAELTERRVDESEALEAILTASKDHDLIAVGACRPEPEALLSLGHLQDQIVDQARADVLVTVVDGTKIPTSVDRILCPVNGLEYSTAASDVAAYLAKASGAEVVLLNVMNARDDSVFRKERNRRHLLEAGYSILREARFRVERLEVPIEERVELSDDPGGAIVRELQRQQYGLIVMGAVDRSGDDRLYLGSPIQTILTESDVPAVLLIAHEAGGEVG